MSFHPSFILLDAARMEDAMETARDLNPNHESLYRAAKGEDEVLPVVAPFLFTWPHSKPFAKFIRKDGWGDSWGVWIDTATDHTNLLKHFRRFLMVQTDDGKQLYFRFYDPRVLRIFLPTCDPEQLRDFFGPVRSFLMEDDDPEQALLCSINKGALQTVPKTIPEITPWLQGAATEAPVKKSWWDW